MRWAALLAITLGCAGAAGASAQTTAPDLTAALSLKQAAFAPVAAGRPIELRVTYGEFLRAPVYAPGTVERTAVDVTLVRSWPKAVSFTSDAFEFDIAPHAGVGMGARGGPSSGFRAEGGATITVERKSRGEQAMARLRDMGVVDGGSYGDAGRFYFFAAASGQAVGLNVMQGAQGWDRAGWSTDNTGALVGDAQVGVGWRKGDVQSSFGVIHREVKGRHLVFGVQTREDTVAAFTLSIRPGR